MKTYPNLITELQENEVFVFGSNLSGLHIGGAARTAVLKFGAIINQAIGLQGKSYAIPTVDASVRGPLSITEIQNYVDEFIAFASQNPALKFLVTDIACGIAGYKVEQIAPLFKGAIPLENVYFSKEFYRVLGNLKF